MSTKSLAFPMTGTAGPEPLRDCLTMLGRQVRRLRRYPELTVIVLVIPIVFLLLFVYVFGGTLAQASPRAAAAAATTRTTWCPPSSS